MKKLFLLVLLLIAIQKGYCQKNPYAQFGCTAPVVKTDAEILRESGTMVILNPDTTHRIQKLEINFIKRIVNAYSKNDSLIASDSIPETTIMRWLTPDPYGQFHSPYVGMGNNWVNMVDPTGGISLDWGEMTDASGKTIYKWFGQGVKVDPGWKTVSEDFNWYTGNEIQHGSNIEIQFKEGTLDGQQFVRNQTPNPAWWSPETTLKYGKTEYTAGKAYPLAGNSTSDIPADVVASKYVRRNSIYKVSNGNKVTITSTGISVHDYGGFSSFGAQEMWDGGWYPKKMPASGYPANSYQQTVIPVPSAFNFMLPYTR